MTQRDEVFDGQPRTSDVCGADGVEVLALHAATDLHRGHPPTDVAELVGVFVGAMSTMASVR